MQTNPNNRRIRHFHDDNGRLCVTIATQFVDEAKELLAVGVAHCGNQDVPSRKMGSQIADGRLTAFLAGRAMNNAFLVRRSDFIDWIKSITA